MCHGSPVLSNYEKKNLERRFDEEEIPMCLKICAIDKAPRPDGYTMGFFSSCW